MPPPPRQTLSIPPRVWQQVAGRLNRKAPETRIEAAGIRDDLAQKIIDLAREQKVSDGEMLEILLELGISRAKKIKRDRTIYDEFKPTME